MTQRTFKSILFDLLREAQTKQNAFFQALPPAELAVIGEPDRWAAKDHVAHLSFWRQRLVLRLQAHLCQEPQPVTGHFEQVNPIVFEENRYRAWSDILSESDQVYADLITLTTQLSEEDLTAFNRFDWMRGMPLYLSFMGNCYEHTQIHLGYYLIDHGNLQGAIETYEAWTGRVVSADESPDTLKGNMLYNLACFYATHDRLAQAEPVLRQAFALYPDTRAFALTDPDLEALRPNLPA